MNNNQKFVEQSPFRVNKTELISPQSLGDVYDLMIEKLNSFLNSNSLGDLESLEVIGNSEVDFIEIQDHEGELTLIISRKDINFSPIEIPLSKDNPKSHFLQILSNNQITTNNFKI